MFGFGRKKYNEEATKALLAGIQNDASAIVRYNLREGANPNARVPLGKDENYGTMLMLACSRGPDALECVQALLKAGADVHAATPTGKTPLVFAILASTSPEHYDKDAGPLIDALVAKGANVKGAEYDGKPLLSLTMEGHQLSVSVWEALLKHQADPNGKAANGHDFLTEICRLIHGRSRRTFDLYLRAAKALVEAGAKVNPSPNPVDDLTATPIFAAVYSPPLLEYLLEKGADPNIVDKTGQTLLETMRRQLNDYLEDGFPIAKTLNVIAMLEDAILRAPDGKGQGGSTAQPMNSAGITSRNVL